MGKLKIIIPATKVKENADAEVKRSVTTIEI